MAPSREKSTTLKAKLRTAASRALGGGTAGAIAMVVQVLALMWMRTTINYQMAKGGSMADAIATLYADGGVPRFYRGVWLALVGAPLSRFGDTAANAGVLALLESVDVVPTWAKTLCASVAAALFRILITPIDTVKTTLQVQGSEGLAVLARRISQEGGGALYSGAIGNSVATLAGHYPWFLTYNFLSSRVPAADGVAGLVRSALLGFCSSFTSDVVSNSIRVVKTAKQTNPDAISYVGTVSMIVAQDGVVGLFTRGLGTKLLSNGIQAMLFTVVWKAVEKKLQRRRETKEALHDRRRD